MVKLVFIVHRNLDMTKEEFRDHWLNVHAPLVHGAQDTIRITDEKTIIAGDAAAA